MYNIFTLLTFVNTVPVLINNKLSCCLFSCMMVLNWKLFLYRLL